MSSNDNEITEVKVLMALADDEKVVISKQSAKNAEDIKVSIPGVEGPWLSEVKGFVLPNLDIGIILPTESQVNTTDPPVAITDSSVTEYDSADESLVCNTPLHPLEKFNGAEPVSGPKTIKSILKSNSTFKVEALKGVAINELSSAPAKAKASASKLTQLLLVN
nr:hypothetical protein [Tanacetum cinerariifolium]